MAGIRLRRKQSEMIFDLITKRKMKEIQEFLKPFRPRQRQAIVSIPVKEEPLLYRACADGCKDIVQYLIDECGADIGQKGRLGRDKRSPLFIAVSNKHSPVTKALVERGADVNTKAPPGTNLVRISWDNNQLTLEKFLVKHGVTINTADNMRESIRNTEYNHFLLSIGIDVNLTDERGRHTLIYAAEVGYLPVVKLLLSHQADIDQRDNNGDNALSVAIYKIKFATESLLMENGYTERDRALAYEFLGCTHVMFNPRRLLLAKSNWLTAVAIHERFAIDLEHLPPAIVSLGPEIEIEELMQSRRNLSGMSLDLKTMQLQALRKLVRIFGPRHQITMKAFVRVSISLISRDYFDTSFENSFLFIEQVLLYNETSQEPILALKFFRAVLNFFSSFHRSVFPHSDIMYAWRALDLLFGFNRDPKYVVQSQLNPFRCVCSTDKYHEARLLFWEMAWVILELQPGAALDQGLKTKVTHLQSLRNI